MRGFLLPAPLPTGSVTPHALVAPSETAVYRLFGAGDRLLYVGIAWNPFKRWATHRRRSAWFAQVERAAVEVYRSEREALRVEREWIKSAEPAWNIRSRCADETASVDAPGVLHQR